MNNRITSRTSCKPAPPAACPACSPPASTPGRTLATAERNHLNQLQARPPKLPDRLAVVLHGAQRAATCLTQVAMSSDVRPHLGRGRGGGLGRADAVERRHAQRLRWRPRRLQQHPACARQRQTDRSIAVWRALPACPRCWALRRCTSLRGGGHDVASQPRSLHMIDVWSCLHLGGAGLGAGRLLLLLRQRQVDAGELALQRLHLGGGHRPKS